MNTVNETGRHAGRYHYRTHELRLPDSLPEGGTVSVVDLKTGEAKILAQDPSYDALDGIRWTPWRIVLFAEEVDNGRLFEIVLDKKNPMSGTVYDRPALGRLAHEGIEVGPDGAVYVVDEQRGLTDSTGCDSTPCGGGVYRFVPDRRGDLSSGKLYVLRVLDNTDSEGVGQAEWAGPIDPLTARASGSAIGGTSPARHSGSPGSRGRFPRPRSQGLARVGGALAAGASRDLTRGSQRGRQGSRSHPNGRFTAPAWIIR